MFCASSTFIFRPSMRYPSYSYQQLHMKWTKSGSLLILCYSSLIWTSTVPPSLVTSVKKSLVLLVCTLFKRVKMSTNPAPSSASCLPRKKKTKKLIKRFWVPVRVSFLSLVGVSSWPTAAAWVDICLFLFLVWFACVLIRLHLYCIFFVFFVAGFEMCSKFIHTNALIHWFIV